MILEVLTPDKKVFSGEVSSVTVPGAKGSFEVLNNHAPIISTLEKGSVKIKAKEGNQELTISGGVIEVLSNKVVVLAESIIS
ncbi:MAG: ATP synthase F1 subunit epsilon [bacterium]|jgi:F-type H+-transporting ATPase subunit epsilon